MIDLTSLWVIFFLFTFFLIFDRVFLMSFWITDSSIFEIRLVATLCRVFISSNKLKLSLLELGSLSLKSLFEFSIHSFESVTLNCKIFRNLHKFHELFLKNVWSNLHKALTINQHWFSLHLRVIYWVLKGQLLLQLLT